MLSMLGVIGQRVIGRGALACYPPRDIRTRGP